MESVPVDDREGVLKQVSGSGDVSSLSSIWKKAYIILIRNKKDDFNLLHITPLFDGMFLVKANDISISLFSDTNVTYYQH